MRAYAGTRLFKVAGHPAYVGVSGRLSFGWSFLFAVGFFLVPVLLARWLK